MARIRVTHTYADGYTESWTTPDGDTEKNRKRRFRRARVAFRSGPGWVEFDNDASAELGTVTERIDWLDHPANAAD